MIRLLGQITWFIDLTKQATRREKVFKMNLRGKAKFLIGQVVKHRFYPFRGIIFDVDPTFSNSEEWWESIPKETRPRKDQPFIIYWPKIEMTSYIAYVSEQNLLEDESGE